MHVNKSFDLKFPADYALQHIIAAGFYAKSEAGFSRCCGCIDRMIVWTEKPSKNECKSLLVGKNKFYSSRKHKFGLNLKGACDYRGCFLDVDINHPRATSDYLSFVTSLIFHKLETPGFLAPGLSLFGDTA